MTYFKGKIVFAWANRVVLLDADTGEVLGGARRDRLSAGAVTRCRWVWLASNIAVGS